MQRLGRELAAVGEGTCGGGEGGPGQEGAGDIAEGSPKAQEVS